MTFGIDREIFAIPVALVQEILDLQPISRLPRAPDYLLGLMDVRGTGLPIIDLRIKLGLKSIEPTNRTRVIILESAGESLPAVRPRHGLRPSRSPTSAASNSRRHRRSGAKWRSDCVTGIGRRGDDFVIVLDLERLIASDEKLMGGPSGRPDSNGSGLRERHLSGAERSSDPPSNRKENMMRLSVKVKLATAFGLIIALTATVGGVAYVKLAAVNDTVDRMLAQRVTAIQTANDVKLHVLQGVPRREERDPGDRATKTFAIYGRDQGRIRDDQQDHRQCGRRGQARSEGVISRRYKRHRTRVGRSRKLFLISPF